MAGNVPIALGEVLGVSTETFSGANLVTTNSGLVVVARTSTASLVTATASPNAGPSTGRAMHGAWWMSTFFTQGIALVLGGFLA